jgi:hypothetical protein
LDKVADAIELTSDNSSLANRLIELGIHKKDGTALDAANMSRIKKVVSHLKADTESTLPLCTTNG